ncbi:hypothetical protein [Microcella sp.]|uniref:hypothetical protein n=1 Tax=Microcella sp. TaxID=1913979 RepID=UPI003F709C90
MSRAQDRELAPLTLSGVPRASLMPAEVALRKREAVRRRGLISIVVLAVLVVAGAIVAATLYAANAEARLAAERAVTEQLLGEQLSYQEVLEVRGQLADILAQRQAVTEREVLWRTIAEPYLAILAADGTLEAATITTAAIADPVLLRQDPLRVLPTATMVLTLNTAGLPAPYSWLRSFETLPAYGDAALDSIVLQADGTYMTTVTVNLSSEALSGRLTDEAANG